MVFMTMLVGIVFVIVGFIFLIKGADWLVEGSSSIARRLGVSDLVIGLTVVSFGTSAPELLVNIVASIQNSADIAIGDIVGSNIANTCLMLGIVAVITPLAVQRSTVRKEIPFGLLAAFVLFIMANDRLVNQYPFSELSRADGLAFLGFFIIFLYYTYSISKHGPNHKKYTKPTRPLWLAWTLVLIGLLGLTAGGHICVDGAQMVATDLGISEALVGLTIVALGTSLPELAASLVAALKGRTDIAVGNVVGSNVFNIFWILGISAIINPLPFKPALNVDLMVVIVTTLILFVIIHNGRLHHRMLLWWKQEKDYRLARWEGVILLLCYVTYIGFIIWRDLTGGMVHV